MGKGRGDKIMDKRKVIEIEVHKNSQHWICPFCSKEIGEKELYFNQETNQWFHRPCYDLGEIEFPNEKDKIILSKLNDKKLIAETLLEIAKNSTTEIIEVDSDFNLIETAEKINIKLPSPDLAVIKTVYAEIDKVNKNGIVLPRKAVEEGLPTLIGKQINWEHDGAGRICGYIIDAQINKDLIEITGVIFKSLFPEEMEKVKEKFQKRTLCVSFEIWNRNPKNKESVVHELEDGIRSIDPIIFHGCGLLLVNPPACPKAKVYKLVAKVLTEAEKIVEKVFNEDLIFASSAIEEPKCKNCTTCTCEKDKEVVVMEEIKLEEILDNDYEGGEIEEAKKLTTEQRNALPDSDFALIQEKDGKKIRRFPINDEAHVRNALARLPQAKDITEEERKSALAKILKKAKELNMEELLKKYEKSSEETQAEVKPEETKTEEKSEVAETKPEEIKAEETKEEPIVEEKKEEATIITTTQEVTKVDETKPDGEVITTEVKTETTVVNNDGKETQKIEEETKSIVTYTWEQVQSEVKTAEEELVAAMPKEVSDRIKELVKEGKSVKEAMKQAWEEYKKSQEKALEEKDKEIQNKTEELATKEQEIADLKNPKVEEKKEPEMTVGTVEVKDNYKTIQTEVNTKAFGKKK